MNVLIIGAGSVGIGVGATLVASGCKVDFIAREATKKCIDAEGISRKGIFGDITIEPGKVRTFLDYVDLPEAYYDYVLITAKTTANEEIAQKLSDRIDCMVDTGKLVFMQNGMGYEKPFLDDFEEEDIYHTRLITGFKREAANVSVVTVHQAPFCMGSIYGYSKDAVKPLAEALSKSGIPAVADDEVAKALWAKLIYNVALNPLGAILDMSYGQLAESSYARAIMDNLIEEAFCVMKAAGASTYWDDADSFREDFFEKQVKNTAEHRSSTLQDIDKKQKTEIDFITGGLLNVASQCEVAAPVNSMVYWLVKAKEESFDL